jgi:hypothetical protein
MRGIQYAAAYRFNDPGILDHPPSPSRVMTAAIVIATEAKQLDYFVTSLPCKRFAFVPGDDGRWFAAHSAIHHCCEHHIPRALFVVSFARTRRLRASVKGDQAG